MSAYRNESSPVPGAVHERPQILVWDLPVRIFHWLLALCFAGAWLTGESESLRLVHVTLGYTMAGLVGFRIVWGLVGTRYARFSNFVQGPAAVGRYLRSLVSRHPEHFVGHNPAGAIAILALLGGSVLLVASGWANYNDIAGHWMEELHEGIANALLALVAVHVAAVLLSSWLHHENLVRAMVNGRKQGSRGAGIAKSSRILGAALLAAVLGFWVWQGIFASPSSGGAAVSATHHGHERD
jgi:cytochrome b